MLSSKVLREIQELRVAWRKQNFHYTSEQSRRYEELKQLRRKIVQQFYKDDRVWIGPSNLSKPLNP